VVEEEEGEEDEGEEEHDGEEEEEGEEEDAVQRLAEYSFSTTPRAWRRLRLLASASPASCARTEWRFACPGTASLGVLGVVM